MTAAAGRIRSGDARRGGAGRGARRPLHRTAGGFTYVSVIILVAIIGLVTATSLRLGATMQRAAAERELLYIGEQFSEALKSYAAATPAGQPQQPPTMKELLKDPRFPGVRRHLRKIFVDPITGSTEWGIIYMGDKVGVLGIHSLSTAQPIKVSNFPARFQAFEGKHKLSEWVFTFNGQEAPPPGQVKPGQGTPQPGTPMTGTPMTGGPMTGSPGQPAGTPLTGAPTTAVPTTPDRQAPPSAPPQEPPPAEPPEPPPESQEPEAPEPVPEPAQEPPAEPVEPPNSK